MDTASSVLDSTRALLDDPERDWATDDYLRPFLNIAYRDLASELGAYGISFDQRVVVIPNVAANTTDLGAYIVAGGPLATMWQPIDLYERPAGGDDSQWVSMRRVAEMLPALPKPNFGTWEFREGNIYLPPSNQTNDLLVRFEEMFPNIADVSEPLRITGAANILACATASLAARSRGGRELAADLSIEARRQTTSLLLRLNKEAQKIRTRQRRYGL